MNAVEEDPLATLQAAKRMLGEAGPRFVWARAATHLTRQALETGVDRIFRARGANGVPYAPMRTQLVCLPFSVDADLARRVAWTWQALSQAGHHQGYEMAPSGQDLQTWIRTVEELLTIRT